MALHTTLGRKQARCDVWRAMCKTSFKCARGVLRMWACGMYNDIKARTGYLEFSSASCASDSCRKSSDTDLTLYSSTTLPTPEPFRATEQNQKVVPIVASGGGVSRNKMNGNKHTHNCKGGTKIGLAADAVTRSRAWYGMVDVCGLSGVRGDCL